MIVRFNGQLTYDSNYSLIINIKNNEKVLVLHDKILECHEIENIKHIENMYNKGNIIQNIPEMISAKCIAIYFINDLPTHILNSLTQARIYFYKNNLNWYLTNDIKLIYPILNNICFNCFELTYYLLNGYCTAFNTYIDKLYKLIPGEVINIEEFNGDYKQRIRNSSITNVLRRREIKFKNYKFFSNAYDMILKENLSTKKKIAVLYSGGADSSFLLFKILKLFPDKNIDAVFFTIKKIPFDYNTYDLKKSLRMVKKLKMKLRIVDSLDTEGLFKTLITNIKKMPFDAHLSIYHGSALRQIEKDYDCIVTGQNADSIYNFGPTGRLNIIGNVSKGFTGMGLAEILKRNFYNATVLQMIKKKIIFYHFVSLKILSHIYNIGPIKKNCISYENFLKGFLSPFKYIPHLHSELFKSIVNSPSYEEKLKHIVNSVLDLRLNEKGTLLYLKFISFMQGSDTRVLTELFNNQSSHQLIFFPFLTNSSLEGFRNLSLNIFDTFKPKRFIYKTLLRKKIGIYDSVSIQKNNLLTEKQLYDIVITKLYNSIGYDSICEFIESLPQSIKKRYFYITLHNYLNKTKYDYIILFRLIYLYISYNNINNKTTHNII